MATDGSQEGTPRQVPEQSVLLVLNDALEDEGAIRKALQQHHFRVKKQCLVTLSEKKSLALLEIPQRAKEMWEKEVANYSAEEGKEQDPADLDPKIWEDMDPEEIIQLRVPLYDDEAMAALLVEKVNAIADLKALVGPRTSEDWKENPECLRAKYAEDDANCGVVCSLNKFTAKQEELFLFEDSAVASAKGSMDGNGRANSKHDVPHKSDKMHMDTLMNFLFPEHLQHHASTSRLFVFALYGPLDKDARLRGGIRGQHVVTDKELDTMGRAIEREDILSVYAGKELTPQQEEEILASADEFMKTIPHWSKEDIIDILDDLPTDKDGNMSFHDMQKAIQDARAQRILFMKKKADAAIKRRKKGTDLKSKSRTHSKAPLVSYKSSTVYSKDSGRTNAEIMLNTAAQLHKASHQICTVETGNDPALTQNVLLLRDEHVVMQDKDWDGLCCVRQKNKGTYVKREKQPSR